MVVKRSHTEDNIAPAVKTLRDDINAAYPNRLKTNAGTDADGIWPSKQHTILNPDSDHEAGNAIDIDDDLSGVNGVPPEITPDMARRLSLHPANNYVLHDSGIYRDGVRYPYQGSNPHTGHAHISIREDRRNDTTHWNVGGSAPTVPTTANYKRIDFSEGSPFGKEKALHAAQGRSNKLWVLDGPGGDIDALLSEHASDAEVKAVLAELNARRQRQIVYATANTVVVWPATSNNVLHRLNAPTTLSL